MGTVLRKLKVPNKSRELKQTTVVAWNTLAQKLSIKARCTAKGPMTALWTEPRAKAALPSNCKRPHGSCGNDFKQPYLFLLPVCHGCHVEEQVQDDGVLRVLPNAVQQVGWQGCLRITYKDRILLDTQCEPLWEGNVKTAVFKNRQSYTLCTKAASVRH